ncbi:MAG TPA: pyruvate kinase [Candidatus Absconditabacterales bacterium]|nr:pyruvate kinase [Candidatus Absconditabacterales bacterium]
MTNIIATIGPAINSEEQLINCYENGIRILRFNFPHYTKETVAKDVKTIRRVEKRIGKKFELLLDTEGPQVRTGVVKTPISYILGERFRIVSEEKKRGDRDLLCDYASLIQDAKIGTIIKIDSGLFDVKVVEKGSKSLVVEALMSFTVGSRRHINTPGIHYKLPTITAKDFDDILFAIQNKFSYIAVSFTRSKKDIQILRDFLKKNKGDQIKIIAKIENQEGIDDIENIIQVSDVIMIARGDLGTELPLETIPAHQIYIIKRCKIQNTPVIVATQMLESMINNPVPTRAEVSDIFYAVREGAEYVMLSGETAIGKYPIACIKVMNKIIIEAEK